MYRCDDKSDRAGSARLIKIDGFKSLSSNQAKDIQVNGMKESSLTNRNESSSGVVPLPLRHAKLAVALTFVLVMLSGFGFCQSALAQQNQKPGAGTTPNMPQNDADETSALANRKRYFDRNPWAKGHHDDDATEDKPGTKNQQAQKPFENFPMPAFQGMVVPDTTSPNTYRITLIPQTVQTKVQRRDVGNITRNYNTIGTWSTDTSRAIHMNQMASKALEMAFDPERLNWNLSANASLGASSASNSAANAGEQTLNTALDRIMDADAGGAFINVANEASGTGGNVGALFRSVPDAVGMVMIMYKHVFVPMAILFLLPGAVISQVKGMVGRGLSNTVSVPEAQHPFDGILRSMVAVFLIPATQVIMSWSIDVGNSLAFSMKDWVDIPMILNWCSELSYDPKPGNYDNAIRMPQPQSNYGGGGTSGSGSTGGGGGILGTIINAILSAIFGGDYAIGEGAAVNMKETATHLERQGYMMVMLQMAFNFMLYVAAVFLVIMSAFQITIMCYLFLLGPLSAAFYAWPQVNSGKVALFRGIFGNWLEAVIKVSLWRFYWMVVLAVVTQRLIYTGGGSGDLQWEVAMFASFLGIMLYVPQQPFDFTPQGSFGKADQVYSQAMQAAQAQSGGGGGGGKGGSPGAGAGGEDSGHHGKEKEHSKDTKTEKDSAPTAAEGTDTNRSSRDAGLPNAAKPDANPNANNNPTANPTPPPPKSENTGAKDKNDGGGDNNPPPGGPNPGVPTSGPGSSAPSSGSTSAPNAAAAAAAKTAMPSVPVGSASASGIKLAGGNPSANVNPGASKGAADSVKSQSGTATAANNNASQPAPAAAPPPQVVQAPAPAAPGGGGPAVANGGTAVANIATSSAEQTKKKSES